jgi:hypothetical protein
VNVPTPITDADLLELRHEAAEGEASGGMLTRAGEVMLSLLARHDAVEDRLQDATQTVAEALGDIALGDTPRAQQRLRELLDALVTGHTRPTAGASGVDGDLTTDAPAGGRTIDAMRDVIEEGCDRD